MLRSAARLRPGRGQGVLYVTEPLRIRAEPDGLELTKSRPGIDIERDISR